MTLEEAKALVLREGLAGYNAPEDSAFVLLHFGDVPIRERMIGLKEAINILCVAMQEETILDRSLTAALWTLGNSSNDCLFHHEKYGRSWRDGAMDEVIDLLLAIEGFFYGIPSEGIRLAVKD